MLRSVKDVTTYEDIKERFGYHPAPPGTDAGVVCATLRTDFIEFAGHLAHHLPEGREKALALTAMQEAAMWAQAALAMTRPLEEE